MSEQPPADRLLRQTMVFPPRNSADVLVERNRPYHQSPTGDALTLDVYRAAGDRGAGPASCVLLVTGFPDPGARRMFGHPFKNTGAFVSWARAIAAVGITAICYENHAPGDVERVYRYVTDHATTLGVDAQRVALWACSGHAPTALAMLVAQPTICAVVLLYPYTLDREGQSDVASAAATFHFAPATGVTAADLPMGVPIFVARAGRDEMPGLNTALDAFVADALRRNLPLTLANHALGAHAFDLTDNSDASHTTIAGVLQFLQLHVARDRSAGSV